VFEALRSWRAQVARERAVPAYTVFHDSTLREIASRRPRSPAELVGITGIGAAKLERFGAAIIDVLRSAAAGHGAVW
jgi:ATP-dependent DNA helicase RecQ